MSCASWTTRGLGTRRRIHSIIVEGNEGDVTNDEDSDPPSLKPRQALIPTRRSAPRVRDQVLKLPQCHLRSHKIPQTLVHLARRNVGEEIACPGLPRRVKVSGRHDGCGPRTPGESVSTEKELHDREACPCAVRLSAPKGGLPRRTASDRGRRTRTRTRGLGCRSKDEAVQVLPIYEGRPA